ncbi:MAG: CopG family transcriptional regulator [Candidatus Krumholzibacteriia bacterium]
MPNDKVTIKIPRRLYVKIQHLITDSGFNSATDFIVYVLRDVLSETGKAEPRAAAAGSREAGAADDESEEFSPEELKALKQKLRNLGYLD